MLTHVHVSMITYRVDVYRSKPIGASLLAGRGDGYQCGLDQVPHGRGNFLGKGASRWSTVYGHLCKTADRDAV